MKMEDERAMGQLVIVKTDTDSKAALEGVEFVLLEKETGKEVGRLKTGKDGKAVSELLPIELMKWCFQRTDHLCAERNCHLKGI